ncbi:MAG: hypothetical protein KAS87_01835, partial [Candidatus Omnitrophica bacterium]|nr:hypothetical protein [Candidatus Omnitrophota bacterium]
VNFEGRGLLFIGHSDAGKSTMAEMLKGKAEILCDDRIIIRQPQTEFRIYGTWSHGDVPDISANSVPLKAIFFLNKSNENHLELLEDRREISKRLLACLIKPFVTAEWWKRMLSLVENISSQVPCYVLNFDKSGGVVDLVEKKIKAEDKVEVEKKFLTFL